MFQTTRSVSPDADWALASRVPGIADPSGSANIAWTIGTRYGGTIASHTGRFRIACSGNPVIVVVAWLTRTTVPDMSATMMMQLVVSRVALVSRSAAAERVSAAYSALT